MSEHGKHLKNLLKGAGFNVLNLAITVVLGFVLVPYIISMLGPRHYVIYAAIGQIVGCFAILDLGIDSAVSRYFVLHFAKGEKRECIEIANTALFLFVWIGLVGFLAISLVGWGIYVLYPDMEDRELFFIVLLINAMVFGLNFPLRALNGIINGTLHQELTGSRDVLFKLLGTGLIVLALYLGFGLIGMALSSIVIFFLNIIILYRLVYAVFPEFVFSVSFYRKELVRKLVSFGTFTFLVFIGDNLSTKGGFFIFTWMVSLEAATSYTAVSVNLSTNFFALMSVIGGGWLITWFTYLHANGEQELLDKSLRLSYKICVYSGTFMLFGLIAWSPDFVTRWLPAKVLDAYPFSDVYPSLILLSLYVWISQIQAPNTKLLFAMAKHHVLGYLAVAGGLINVASCVVLVYCGWGITGIALSAFVIETCVRGIIIPVYVRFLLGESVVVYYLRLLSYVFVAAVACVVPGLISYALLAPSYPRIFLVGGLCAMAYAPTIFFLGFDRSERTQIIDKAKKSLTKSRG